MRRFSRRTAWVFVLLQCSLLSVSAANLPIVVNTWPFTNATAKAWAVLKGGGSVLDAVERGCAVCEREQCDGTVGFGGSPDTNGETTLDAAIFDGDTMDMGAVGYLRRIRDAVAVARAVMTFTSHALLSGEGATAFAKSLGFKESNLTTAGSKDIYDSWVENKCQPNFYQHLVGANSTCGPYKPEFPPPLARPPRDAAKRTLSPTISRENHDTIAMLAVDASGSVAAATSTNGARHKVAGRIGDSPLPGAGLYADSAVGAAGATGDGGVMMRFLPSYRAVLNMKAGMTPTQACEEPLREIARFYPMFQGALVCVTNEGQHGAAAYGWTFHYSVREVNGTGVEVIEVPPFQ